LKILLIQRKALGDALYTSLIGKVLKEEIKGAEIGFLTLKPMCELSEKLDFIDKCFVYTNFWDSLRKIRDFSPEVVLDYEATFKTYPLVLLSGAKKRIAFFAKKREKYLYLIYTDRIKKEHFGYTFWDRLKLLEPLGIDYKKFLKTFIPLEESKSEENFIVFSPKGKIKTKEIRPEVVALIKERIENELNVEVKVFVEPKEVEYVELLKKNGIKPYTFGLKDFYEFVKKSKGVLTIEGFAQHLGLLLNKRVLTIIQSRYPWFEERFDRLFYYYPSLDCLGCGKNTCPKGSYECTYKIDAGEIVKLVGRFILNSQKA